MGNLSTAWRGEIGPLRRPLLSGYAAGARAGTWERVLEISPKSMASADNLYMAAAQGESVAATNNAVIKLFGKDHKKKRVNYGF